MNFAGMNYLAIVVATIAAFAFGAAWYSALSKPWIRAARLDPSSKSAPPLAPLLVTSFICELVMAWVMAGVIGHLGAGQVTLWNGVVSGFFLWVGFLATSTAVNQRYEGYGWDLTAIDAGHWLGVAVIMGGVIGWFGV
jgi:hypothetical protein